MWVRIVHNFLNSSHWLRSVSEFQFWFLNNADGQRGNRYRIKILSIFPFPIAMPFCRLWIWWCYYKDWPIERFLVINNATFPLLSRDLYISPKTLLRGKFYVVSRPSKRTRMSAWFMITGEEEGGGGGGDGIRFSAEKNERKRNFVLPATGKSCGNNSNAEIEKFGPWHTWQEMIWIFAHANTVPVTLISRLSYLLFPDRERSKFCK